LDGRVFVLVERVIAFLAVQAAVGIVAEPVRPEKDQTLKTLKMRRFKFAIFLMHQYYLTNPFCASKCKLFAMRNHFPVVSIRGTCKTTEPQDFDKTLYIRIKKTFCKHAMK
jgi:hypothetical protein